MSHRTLLSLLLFFLTLILASAVFAPMAHASPGFLVTKTADTNDGTCDADCSLREAITATNANAPTADLILFNVSGTITLGSALPAINDDLTIDGTGQNVTVDGANAYQVLAVNSGKTVSLHLLTIQNGAARFGGGVNNAGTLNIDASTFSANRATGNASTGGGAIFNSGVLNVQNSTFTGNLAGPQINDCDSFGGALDNNGTATVTNSTFSGNIVHSHCNDSVSSGGAIYNGAAHTLSVTNSTISGNDKVNSASAGGIRNQGGPTPGTLNLRNSILANNGVAGDCISDGTVGTTLNNIIVVNGTGGILLCGAASTANPLLAPIGPNGGPTQTFALQENSPALGAGDDTTCGNAVGSPNFGAGGKDQRGVTRPQGPHCDIGAFEATTQFGPNFVVNDTADTDDGKCDLLNVGTTNCTLREAINAANAHSGTDTITFDATVFNPGTITLTGALPNISTNMDITGLGADKVIVDGATLYLPFNILGSTTVNLSGLTITRGKGASGGLLNNGTTTISNSTFSGNTASGSGGGIGNGGTLTVIGSTFSGNSTAPGLPGGGIENSAGTLNVINSTFYQNSAGFGGGIGNGGTLTITNSTLSDNSATLGGGIGNSSGTITLNNSIVANSTSGGDCSRVSGTVNAQNSLIEDGLGCVNGTNTNNKTGDPNLGTFQNNGGTTDTMALGATSIAINAGDNTVCNAAASSPTFGAGGLDQRGIARPQGPTCDMGAFELQYTPTQAGPNFIVNHTADTDDSSCDTLGNGIGNQDCTLREAINAANAHSGADTIGFSVSGTITVAGSPLPALNDDVTIDGTGQLITVDGASTYEVMVVNSGKSVTVNLLTIAHGSCDFPCIGAGGIDNNGTLRVLNSTFDSNSSGGGVTNNGVAGAIQNKAGANLSVENSFFTGNLSLVTGSGGGILNSGAASVTNSTFYNNSAASGSGIENTATLNVTNSTFSGNVGFATIENFGTATLYNTIVSGASPACSGTPSVSANTDSIATDASCGGATTKTTGQINLAAPANNGGPTFTMALQNPSAAIDAGNDAVCAAAVGSPSFGAGGFDQRGVARPVTGCDVGAFELQHTAQTGPNFVVNDAADTDDGSCDVAPGNCTLREAINAANALSGADTITFNIPFPGTGCNAANTCTITLTSLLPNLNDDVTINGAPNSGKITVSGNSQYHLFYIASGKNVTLDTLTLANGNFGGDGGGIYNDQGTLNVLRSTITNNTAHGDGIHGGGIFNTVGGTLNVVNSTFAGNKVLAGGSDGAFGGGIGNSGTLRVTNSTFSGNSVAEINGGPERGGGIYNETGTTTLYNTIVASSPSGGDCYVQSGTLTADSYNMDSDGSCNNATTATTVQLALGTLADNGGPTQTMGLGYKSAAVDAGDNTVCADTSTVNKLDQRGQSRNDLNCDVGAFEFVNSDGDTIAKTNLTSGPLFTFGPTLAGVTSAGTYTGTLTIQRVLTAPTNGTPPANMLPITWNATDDSPIPALIVTLCYDPGVLTSQVESSLHVFHYNGSAWVDLGGNLDTTNHLPYHCVTATTAVTGLSPFGLAPSSTTAVDVSGLKESIGKKGAVQLHWRTFNESFISGFNVYRRVGNGKWVKVNAHFLNAKQPGAPSGARYTFKDHKVKPNKTYRYKIEIVYTDNHSEWSAVLKVQTP